MHWHQSKISPSRLRRRPLHSAVAALLAPFVTVMTVLEPNPKRVEAVSVCCDSVRLRSRTEVTMPWSETTRREYERRGRRFASDMTDG